MSSIIETDPTAVDAPQEAQGTAVRILVQPSGINPADQCAIIQDAFREFVGGLPGTVPEAAVGEWRANGFTLHGTVRLTADQRTLAESVAAAADDWAGASQSVEVYYHGKLLRGRSVDYGAPSA